jgi:hypothetical protein
MPRFERRDVNNPPVHAAWWDEGEEVVLRPRKSFAMVEGEALAPSDAADTTSAG